MCAKGRNTPNRSAKVQKIFLRATSLHFYFSGKCDTNTYLGIFNYLFLRFFVDRSEEKTKYRSCMFSLAAPIPYYI